MSACERGNSVASLPPLRLSQVILMTMGQTAYFGSAADSLGHFARLGHEPTGLVNPADYLLEVNSIQPLINV